MSTIALRKNNLFPSIFDDLFNDEWLDNSTRKLGDTLPAVNIKESEKSFELEVAVPGLKKENIKIDVEREVLTISSEQTHEREEGKEGYTRREFHFNSFKRSFSIPESVDVEKIDASYKDGILNIALPKKEEMTLKSKSIQIK